MKRIIATLLSVFALVLVSATPTSARPANDPNGGYYNFDYHHWDIHNGDTDDGFGGGTNCWTSSNGVWRACLTTNYGSMQADVQAHIWYQGNSSESGLLRFLYYDPTCYLSCWVNFNSGTYADFNVNGNTYAEDGPIDQNTYQTGSSGWGLMEVLGNPVGCQYNTRPACNDPYYKITFTNAEGTVFDFGISGGSYMGYGVPYWIAQT